ncbi:hypothetical protein DN752_19490 [Echinicola strongylocentroti]|uniref:Uncharacterized protein n=1 Tax=Echinicola strongylocentroti TaxID=1795355 RepID=A0A2Z4IN34_9BACT|nr:hypothetical protein [Echinicola strongylocentroti]AWW32147.1 hypothetical protein DN752_19490 [Echinicola strongylocentroti]
MDAIDRIKHELSVEVKQAFHHINYGTERLVELDMIAQKAGMQVNWQDQCLKEIQPEDSVILKVDFNRQKA